MTAIKDSKGNLHELPYYEIKGLFDRLAEVAVQSDDYEYRMKKYKEEVTRFSSGFEFSIYELGWSIIDPFGDGSLEIYDDKTYPIMSDSEISYNPHLNPTLIVDGFIDEKGYIGVDGFKNREDAASIILMHMMSGDKDLYENYMKLKAENPDMSKYNFLVSLPNVVGIKRNEMEPEKFDLTYASYNEGKVGNFISYLEFAGKIAKNNIVSQDDEPRDIMIAK